jgi:MerR family transcriptional regulator/heat shock protein HspR
MSVDPQFAQLPEGPEGLSDRPVYVISVAAELAGMHPQTLRGYDRMGLVVPGRAGRARRYSDRDVAQLREVARLSQEEGVGLAGIRRILALQRELALLRRQVAGLRDELDRAHRTATQELDAALAAHRNAARRDLVPLREAPGTSVVVWRRNARNR